MTRERDLPRDRDIERVLEHWLIDGVNEMPDRVFQSIFDRVERQPQAFAPRLLRRLPEMNGSLRWIAAAAAVVLIAVVGFAVLGRPSDSGVGSQPTPTATPAPTPSSRATLTQRETSLFDPFGRPGQPGGRGGVMTYATPEGWIYDQESPLTYTILRVGEPNADNAIFLRSDVVLHSQAEGCPEAALEGAERTPRAMADWLAAHAGVDASTPERVTIGGYEGLVIDLAMSPDWTRTCPFSSGRPAVPLFSDIDPAPDGFDWNIGPDERMRIYLIDLGDGRLLWIDINAVDEPSFQAMLPEATAIVESIQFDSTTP